jgi:polyhydroxyalkanoate synthesis regulator phasin
MKQTLKIGITVLVVAALAMSGIALAQTADDAPAVEDTKAYAALQDKLAPLVEDGTITQAQADTISATLAEGMRPHRGRRGFQALRATAEFLELTPEEMREALSEYDTLADIAAANGSSGAALIDYLVGQVEEHLNQAVEDGKMTEDEAAEKLANAEEHITELVNSEIPEPHQGRGPGRPGAQETNA